MASPDLLTVVAEILGAKATRDDIKNVTAAVMAEPRDEYHAAALHDILREHGVEPNDDHPMHWPGWVNPAHPDDPMHYAYRAAVLHHAQGTSPHTEGVNIGRIGGYGVVPREFPAHPQDWHEDYHGLGNWRNQSHPAYPEYQIALANYAKIDAQYTHEGGAHPLDSQYQKHANEWFDRVYKPRVAAERARERGPQNG